MEASLFALAACASGFVSAAMIGASAADRRLRAGFAEGARSPSFAKRVLARGIPGFTGAARAALRSRTVRERAVRARSCLEARGIVPVTEEGVCSAAFCLGASVFAVASVLSGGLVGGVAVLACAVGVGMLALGRAKERGEEALRAAVPDALRAMGTCFQAGLSLEQTLRQVARETDGELSRLFEESVRVIEMGGTIPEALERMRAGRSEELSFVSVALDIQHSSGGSMKNVLAAAGDSVSADLALRRTLKVQTAQAKLSAQIVSLMPFVLIAVFSLTTEGFLSPFFESVAGMALLALACAMQVSGIVMVRRMLTAGSLR